MCRDGLAPEAPLSLIPLRVQFVVVAGRDLAPMVPDIRLAQPSEWDGRADGALNHWMPSSGCRVRQAMVASEPFCCGNLATVAVAPIRMPVIRLVQATKPTTTAPTLPSVTAAADMPMLTRGARRRQKQRLRRKLGKLEHAGDAAELAEQAVFAEKSSSEAVDSSVASTDDEVKEVPFFVTNEIAQQRRLDLPMAGLSFPISAGEKVVPVCAIQKDVKLHEAAEVEITDVLVALPCQGKQQARSRSAEESEGSEDERATAELRLHGKASECQSCDQWRAGADSRWEERSWALDARAHAGSSACTLTWPLTTGAQLPTVNTFVHFHANYEQPRRRSLSV